MRMTDTNEHREVFPLESRQRFERVNVLEGCFFLCPPDWSVYNLRYNYHRLYYIYDGEATYFEGDRRVPLRKGRLYVFPSQSKRYAITHNPERPLRVLWCHFEMLPDIVNDLIEFDPSRDQDFLELLGIWRRIVDLPQPGNESNCIVLLMLYMLERRVPFSYASHPFDGIERYISEHIADSLNVERLAANFGYGRSHFSRKFKKEFNLSPGEYIKTIRMSGLPTCSSTACPWISSVPTSATRTRRSSPEPSEPTWG